MKKRDSIDGELVLQFQSGNKQALTHLVKRWHKTFCEKAYWLVKDTDVAKDIAQDSWQVIISKINQLKDPYSFSSWASRIVYSKSLDWLKASKRKQNHLEDYKYEQEVDNLETKENESIKAQLLKTIKTLPEHQQMVIKLFYVQGYSLKEISSVLNISVGTTKSRLFHTREKLKQILKHRNYEN